MMNKLSIIVLVIIAIYLCGCEYSKQTDVNKKLTENMTASNNEVDKCDADEEEVMKWLEFYDEYYEDTDFCYDDYVRTEINIIKEPSYMIEPKELSKDKALEIIKCIDSTISYNTYYPFFIYHIQKFVDFNSVKYIYSDTYRDYYYSRFIVDDHDFYIVFSRIKDSDYDLVPDCAFFSDKMFKKSDFTEIVEGESTIYDVNIIDSLTMHENSTIIRPLDSSDRLVTFHIIDEGIIFITYNFQDNTYVVKDKYIEIDGPYSYQHIVATVSDNQTVN